MQAPDDPEHRPCPLQFTSSGFGLSNDGKSKYNI